MTEEFSPAINALFSLGEPDSFGGGGWTIDYAALGITNADVPALRKIASIHFDYRDGEETPPEAWAALHAWRALAEFGAVDAVDAMLARLERSISTPEEDWSMEDIVWVSHRLGAAAAPALIDYFNDLSRPAETREWVSWAIERVGAEHPEIRNDCVKALTSALRRYREQDDMINASLIDSLLELKADETLPLIEETFRADRVDLAFGGDWEDVLVDRGTIPERTTPRTWDTPEGARVKPGRSYRAPVDALLALGRPAINRIDAVDYASLGVGAEHVADLIRMMCDEELHRYAGDAPSAYAPIHAWRALAQLRALEAVDPLLSQWYRFDADGDDWISEEFPKVFERLGVHTLPRLEGYVADRTRGPYSRMSAIGAIEGIVAAFPDSRDRVVACLSSILVDPLEEDPVVNADCISALTKLKAVECAPLMQAAFEADVVDTFVCGDWEDIQVELGLLSERATPRRPSMMDRFLADERDRAQHAAQHSSHKKNKSKSKSKRKQQKAARKKNRR